MWKAWVGAKALLVLTVPPISTRGKETLKCFLSLALCLRQAIQFLFRDQLRCRELRNVIVEFRLALSLGPRLLHGEARPSVQIQSGFAAYLAYLANVAVVISRRPFLPDAEAPWIESERTALRAMQMRALQCLVTVSAGNAEPVLAIQHAIEMVELDPFRETAYQLLMKMHAAAGDRAEALRVFAKCREVLRDELGVSPSPQTEAVFLEILRAE